MSSLKSLFHRQRKETRKEEYDVNDPELGHIHTALPATVNILHHKAQSPWRESSQTTNRSSSLLSAKSDDELPNQFIPADTTTTRAVSRPSYSDSEFSQHQIPVSPDRYDDVLRVVERSSPTTPERSNLNPRENVGAHESITEIEGRRSLTTDQYGHSTISTGVLVPERFSDEPISPACTPPLSDDQRRDADLISHSFRNAGALIESAKLVDRPRYVVNAVDLPYTAQSAFSSESLSANIENPSSQSAGNSEQVMRTLQLHPGSSASSSGSNFLNSDEPIIDITTLEGNIETRSTRSFQSASGSHYSIVIDNSGFRPMSEGEIAAELQATMQSLEEMSRSGQSIWSLSQESSRANIPVQVREDGQPVAEQNLLPLRPLGQRLTKLDPGSSQTSSSMSADHFIAAISSHGGRVASYKECSSSSQFRSPTPPLLFGRRTISSHQSQKSEGLAQSYAPGSGVEDWETVSDMKSNMRGLTNDAVDTETGSSLADNSDPGDVSVTEPNTGRLRKLGTSQHPELPRRHQAFVIVKDDRSGDTTNVPQDDFGEGRNYQHPVPMAERHLNPFISSPPVIKLRDDSTDNVEHNANLAHQVLQKRMSVKSSSTGGFDKLIDSYGSINDSRNRQNMDDAQGEVVNQAKQETASKEPSRGSSVWLSTVSENASGEEPSLPLRSGSFAKVTVLNSNGNLTGTPQGTGAREVGSSLAGASSPRDLLSSSPVPSVNSGRLLPISAESPRTPLRQAHLLKMPEFPTSVASRLHTPPHPQTPAPLAILEASSSLTSVIRNPIYQNITGNVATPDASSINSSVAQSPTDYRSAASEFQAGLTSKARALNLDGPPKQRPHGSSSESNSKVIASPSTIKAPALPSPGPRGHKMPSTMVNLSSNHSAFDDAESEDSQHPKTVGERHGDQDYTENSQAFVSTTPCSTLHDGVVYSDVASPVLMHPVYGSMRLLDDSQKQRGRVQGRPDKLQRPMAHVESPHLHRIPHTSSADILKRREQISKLWLPIFCAIPPCALLLGYGYADEIMRIQSGGIADSFTDWSKMFAIFWALSATPVTIVIAVVCVEFGSSM